MTFTDIDGRRVIAFITDTPTGAVAGQLGGLDLRHRQHARIEDRIRQAKATGLRNLPFHTFNANGAWLLIVGTAARITLGTRRTANQTPFGLTSGDRDRCRLAPHPHRIRADPPRPERPRPAGGAGGYPTRQPATSATITPETAADNYFYTQVPTSLRLDQRSRLAPPCPESPTEPGHPGSIQLTRLPCCHRLTACSREDRVAKFAD